MALTLTIVDQQWVAPATMDFNSHANVNLACGSGTGRALLAFAIMGSDSATSEPQTCRAGSTSGSGGTLMTAGSLQSTTAGTHNSSRLFTLDSAAVDAAGSGLTGTKEIWAAYADGNIRPGLLAVMVQSDDGSDLTVGDLAVLPFTMSGSAAATQSVGSPSANAVGIVFTRTDGSIVATASSGSTLLTTGQTNGANFTVDVIQKPGTGGALTVGWQPGSSSQVQARHAVSLTKAGGGATGPGTFFNQTLRRMNGNFQG